MPAVYVAKTVEMVIQGVNANGSDEYNVLHFFKPAGSPTITDLGNLANTFDAHVKTQWLACHAASYTLNSLRLFSMESPSAPYLDYPEPAGTRGTHGGTPASSGVALAVTVQTPYRGRSNRGRIYFGSLSTSGYTNDVISITEASIFSTLMLALFAVGNYCGLYLGVTSRRNLVTIVANSYRINTDLDSQRRRLPGRGR